MGCELTNFDLEDQRLLGKLTEFPGQPQCHATTRRMLCKTASTGRETEAIQIPIQTEPASKTKQRLQYALSILSHRLMSSTCRCIPFVLDGLGFLGARQHPAISLGAEATLHPRPALGSLLAITFPRSAGVLSAAAQSGGLAILDTSMRSISFPFIGAGDNCILLFRAHTSPVTSHIQPCIIRVHPSLFCLSSWSHGRVRCLGMCRLKTRIPKVVSLKVSIVLGKGKHRLWIG